VNRLPTLLASLLTVAALALIACGGDSGGSSSTSTTANGLPEQGDPESGTETASCGPIEDVDVQLGGNHLDKDFTAADYPTNPPTGGDHNPNPLQAGTYYVDSPPRLGEAVHLLEHGAVIGWVNDVSKSDLTAIENEFNAIFQDGYYQLAVVDNPDLDVPFALSAWGALQTCKKVDVSAIRPFVEEWYASPKSAEGGLACQGDARTLPNC
jgi:hypothetical protein